MWSAAGGRAPGHRIDGQDPLIVDSDATLVTAHSEKESAAPTFKRGFGFHPVCAFVDHGPTGTGEPWAMVLRPGNAGSDTEVRVRAGAWVAELTGPIDLSGWPDGMRIIVRRERPHPTRNYDSPTPMGCG